MKKGNKLSILLDGIIKENPVMVLVLGTTTSVANGFGMGISAMAVLICSNFVISLLRKVIPDKVRIPCYIVLIAGFVTMVQFMLQAFVPSLYASLGLFIPLIVVNCIILGRAEMFASKNTVFDSVLDGIGMGLGFTLALVLMGTVREVLGSGTWLGMRIIPESIPTMGIMTLAPGGFLVYAVIMACVRHLTTVRHKVEKQFTEEDYASVKDAAENLNLQKGE